LTELIHDAAHLPAADGSALGRDDGERASRVEVAGLCRRVSMRRVCHLVGLAMQKETFVTPTPGNPARSKGNSDAEVSTGTRFDGEALAKRMGSPRA
jgi:hypothetical protein